jgi:hypothetical protein
MTEKHVHQPTRERATLKAEAAALLAKARSELVELQVALAFTSDAGLKARLAAQVANLSGVVDSLSQALHSSVFTLHASDLMALEHAVQAGAVSATTAETPSIVATDRARAEAVVTASAAYTRRETESVEHDVFDRKIFDRYLHFSSPEDEAAYRRREAETKRYIDAQLARHTPEGDLNAGGGMQTQLLDAQAHGAGASPDFMPRWNALADTTQRQRAAMHAAGQSTAEYDHVVGDAVHRYLKDKGLTDAQIKARLAVSASPIDAVKPYIDSPAPSYGAWRGTPSADTNGHPPSATPGTIGPGDVNFDAVAAKLKASGLQLSDNGSADPAHGLSVAKPAGAAIFVPGT